MNLKNFMRDKQNTLYFIHKMKLTFFIMLITFVSMSVSMARDTKPSLEKCMAAPNKLPDKIFGVTIDDISDPASVNEVIKKLKANAPNCKPVVRVVIDWNEVSINPRRKNTAI